MLPLITAALPYVGAAVGGYLGYRGIQQQNAANAQQAQNQMNFQADQTGTAYQRAVEDMRKAGLNPALAYQQGGASSGGGAQANLGSALGGGVNGAVAMQQAYANVAKTQAETRQIKIESAARLANLEASAAHGFQQAGRLGMLTPHEARIYEERAKQAHLDTELYEGSFAEQKEAYQLHNQLTRTNARQGAARAQLDEYLAPGYRNDAKAENMFYRRNISRHAQDAMDVGRMFFEMRSAGHRMNMDRERLMEDKFRNRRSGNYELTTEKYSPDGDYLGSTHTRRREQP